ncbi:MAG TPA: TlpA disulfide reductase family protein [Pirellulales bacterium]|nr:TlpA disulfide reductase family protein [Pirellulales bacterium]
MDGELEHAPAESRLPKFWVFLAILAAGLVFWLALPHQEHPGEMRQELRSLSLQPLTFDGEALTLDDLKGKVVVLNFWGTWCPPCRLELPHIAELANRYQGSHCRVLAVSCGSSGPDPASSLPKLKSETTALLKSTGLELPVYADPNASSRKAVSAAVGFKGYPTTLVLDAKGIVRRVWSGYGPGVENEIAETVDRLLADQPEQGA